MKKVKQPLGQAHYSIESYTLSNPNYRQINTVSEWKEGLHSKPESLYSLEFDKAKNILMLYFFERNYNSKKQYEKNLFLCFLLTTNKRKCAQVKVTVDHFWTAVGPGTDEAIRRKTYIEGELAEAKTIPGMIKQALENKKNEYTPEDRHNNNESIRIEDLQKHALIGSLAMSVAVLAAGLATGFCLPEYINLIATITTAAIALIIIVSVSVAITQKKYRELTPKKREKLIAEMHPVHRIDLDNLKKEAAALLKENDVEANTDDLPEPQPII